LIFKEEEILYSINEVASMCDITAHTLRYYDKEGLLPFVERNSAGNRTFSARDVEIVKLICCLKNTGMPIKAISKYISMLMQGEETIEARREMMINHRKEVLKQMNELKLNLNIINLKIKYYDSHEINSE